jgi:hypothetical protein
MASFKTILTHPGGAHKDEFLACSVLLATCPVPVVRHEPSLEDLADPATCVVDVGHRHEPALNNFDHHQLPKEGVPTCALSLVLKHLGMYEDTRAFCEWLEPAEWFDCRGPFATADWLGVDRDVLAKLNSPIDATLLRRFALEARLESGTPLWEIMRMIGQDLLDYVTSLRSRLNYLKQHAEFWSLEVGGETAEVLFVARAEPPLDDPSMGLDRFIEQEGKQDAVIGTVTPDRRSAGYGLSRFRDNARLDFTRIGHHPDVHFAHARGFVAKTSAAQKARLRQLIVEAGAK